MAARGTGSAGNLANAQEWLNRRLAPLEPSDFEDGIHIYCTAELAPPPNFQHVWTVYQGAQGAIWPHTAEELAELQAIIIFSNPTDDAQVASLCRVVQAIDGLGHDAPPILWVPHTVAPDSGIETWEVDVADPQMSGIVTHLLELGLDGMVPGEPEGFRLALAVRAKLHKLACLSRTLNDVVNERRSRAQYADYLMECIDCMLWDYLRIRLAPSIPPIDYELPPGELRSLDNFDFGNILGRGMYGSVYKMHPRPGSAIADGEQVVKVVSKANIKDLAELKFTRRQIEVMTLLASEQWAHPNVIKLFQTYHSTTHLYFRMEFGGPENLFRRLHHRQKEGEQKRPLTLPRCKSLIEQAVAVVAHLHTGPRVCHRDLKPENFIIEDTPPHPIMLKLADFDLAIIQQGNSMCRSSCGTVPFTAPEVLLQREYSGMAADIWSLGIVLLEILCGVRIVEKVLSLGSDGNGGQGKPGDRPDDSIGQKIRNGFARPGTAGSVLQAKCRPELQPLLTGAKPVLNGMLMVNTQQRWTAEQMSAGVQAFPPLGPDA